MAMVFIHSYSGTHNYNSSRLVGSWMGVDNIPYIGRRILFRTIYWSNMASKLAEDYAREWLSNSGYSSESMDNTHIPLNDSALVMSTDLL